ncbi:MAG: type II secretion system protein GspD [Candidatus Methylacidiphilales bacterium]|nr:hypothetical protein [Candidatus Methylacidiphilales bacterium]
MTTILRTTLRGLSLLGVLLMAAPLANAQPAGPKPLELEVSETQTLPGKLNDGATPPTNLEVKSVPTPGTSGDTTEIKGKEVGKSTLTLIENGQPVEYAINVVPAPQRIYINLNESTRLKFNDDIDEVSFSNTRFVRQRQPNNRTLLLEAIAEGKSAVTVITKNGTIYQYLVSTFDNRGADILRIRNSFTAKGYKSLTITFERDQATLAGFVATQEELDDAIKIVKQFTPYVDVKVTLGVPEAGADEYSEDEAVIANNIQTISKVKGLTIKVKFPRPTIRETNNNVVQTGDLLNQGNTTVANNGTTVTTPASFQIPTDGAGITDYRPRESETITRSVTRLRTTPEKVFLYGELEDDLEEARVLRVARTFCPLVVSFINVKDPIQVRMKIRFLSINKGKVKDTGVLWTDSAGSDQPSIGAGLRFNSQQAYTRERNNFGAPTEALNSIVTKTRSAFESMLYGLTIDVEAQLRLIDTNSFGRVLQETSVNLTNGQLGYFFSGTRVPYVSSTTIAENGIVTNSISYLDIGARILVLPLNLERASQNPGESISISFAGSEQTRVPTLGKIMNGNITRPLINGAEANIIDESVKYVDENGMIGMNIEANVSTLDGFNTVALGQTAPQTTDTTISSRNQVRDGQSVVLGGVFSDTFTKNVRGLPYLRNIPLFSWLFENPSTTRANIETIAVFTPEIIRMRDMDSKRNPRPEMPETEDTMRDRGEVPVLKALPYKPTTVEMRPVAGSDIKAKTVTPVAVKDRPSNRSEMPEKAIASKTPKAATLVPVASKKQNSKSTAEVAPRPQPLPPVEAAAPAPVHSGPAPAVEDRPAGAPTINTEFGPAASKDTDKKTRPSSAQASLSNTAPETIP